MPWPIDKKFISEAEQSIGAALPAEYKISMMSMNGGAVKTSDDIWSLHPIWDKSNKKRLTRTSNDILRETKAMVAWIGWPENAICIGSNGTGDALIFLIQKNVVKPTVYKWNHETGQTVKIAENFSKLKKA